MICQRCKKKQATVHMTDLSSAEKTEVHLCEECSRKEGVTLKGQVSLADFLSGLIKAPATAELRKLAEMKCGECGINYAQFQATGRLGCPKDYDVFRTLLEPLLEKIHGGSDHAGKSPARGVSADSLRLTLVTLRRQLKIAVEEEKYELAAQLRDEVRKLEGGESGA